LIGEAAKTWATVYAVLSLVGVAYLLAVFLPNWNKMEKRHDDFQKDHEAFRKKIDQE
jgi:hypothetical protein